VAPLAQAGEKGTEVAGEPVQQLPVAADGEDAHGQASDVSPLALRMSSPFNAGYWLAAA
jgi:hypothetical protein